MAAPPQTAASLRAPGGTGRVGELLRRVRRLEVVARRNAAGLLAGDYQTSIRGQGLVFHEARRYVPGEDARRIDWNITARLGEPYVRVHHEERQREVVLAVDVSPSMHLGWQRRTKLETAVEVAATLAVSAVDAGDRLGWVIFADRVLSASPPRGGRPQLFLTLRALLEATAPWERPVAVSDPRAAIHAVQQQRSAGRLVVFLVSDFVDHDVPEDLRYVAARHDVSLLHVHDPLELPAEAAAPQSLETRPLLDAASPEGGRRAPVRPGELGTLPEMETFLRREAARYGLAVASVSTAEPVVPALRRFFHRRGRGR